MKRTSIVCGVVFLLCLLALPSIGYIGGRVCMPLWVPPFLPAQVVPLGIGFVAGVFLLGAVVRSLIARRDRRWTLGVLAVVIAATGAFRLAAPHSPGYLHGLRDRFVSKVGYARMRQFAEEVSRHHPLVDSEGILIRPDRLKAGSPEQIEQWNDLVSRYPFLNWNFATGTVIAREGLVELTWGSPLVGHWGFQVATTGEVTDLDPDRAWFLRVAEDIQFVNYFD
ncbi:hypothetical protein [Anaerobaca lacustris]|uniref:Uncharacterized protein n=1 Tax=Anaerobaca lacustris TaxID=3044600 RepID=A0AAW6U4W5_9BACT|nr:hypothetical protein [Sedimentisphaerales bacterium M17dextr]